jgi:hypothetical protein
MRRTPMEAVRPGHAIAATRDLVVRVADPIRFIEVATGRARCASVFPTTR